MAKTLKETVSKVLKEDQNSEALKSILADVFDFPLADIKASVLTLEKANKNSKTWIAKVAKGNLSEDDLDFLKEYTNDIRDAIGNLVASAEDFEKIQSSADDLVAQAENL